LKSRFYSLLRFDEGYGIASLCHNQNPEVVGLRGPAVDFDLVVGVGFQISKSLDPLRKYVAPRCSAA
jgi:hypothetical protein